MEVSDGERREIQEWVLPASRSLKPELRAELEALDLNLAAYLAPVPKEHRQWIKNHVHAMVTLMGNQHSTPQAAPVYGELYTKAIEDLPYFALREAFQAATQGRVNEGRFAPTPAELRAFAKRASDASVADHNIVRRALAAKVKEPVDYSPEKKAEVRAAHEAIRQSLAKAADADPLRAFPGPPLRAANYDADDPMPKKGADPLKNLVIGGSLRAVLAKWTQTDDTAPTPPQE